MEILAQGGSHKRWYTTPGIDHLFQVVSNSAIKSCQIIVISVSIRISSSQSTVILRWESLLSPIMIIKYSVRLIKRALMFELVTNMYLWTFFLVSFLVRGNGILELSCMWSRYNCESRRCYNWSGDRSCTSFSTYLIWLIITIALLISILIGNFGTRWVS